MILPDFKIAERCLMAGLVSPYIRENVQPASIDLCLGNEFRVFHNHDIEHVDLDNIPDDMTELVRVGDEEHFILHPGEFVLGVTYEQVWMPDDLVGRVEGKSSLGRLGLIVHATAGFIDPGFHGRVTLEMTNLLRIPIKMRPGRLICQISFHQMSAPAQKPYSGRYQGDMSVAPSRYGQQSTTQGGAA